MEAQAGSSLYEARQAFNMDVRIASLFEPDTLLSAQYFGNLRRKTLLEPEKRLMLAILEDAINCYQDNLLAKRGREGRLFTEAEEWILEKGSDWIFSFKNICVRLCRLNGSWIHSIRIHLHCIDAKHGRLLEVIKSSAGKNHPAPEMEIGNEVPAMLERWSPGDIPGLH